MTLTNHLPRHIAIVMDGNGRWASKHGKPRIEGHQAGVSAVKKIVAACVKKGVSTLSLFAFSSENWQRPPEEVNFLMELFLLSLQGEIDELDQQQIRLCFSGDRTILNTALQEQMTIAEHRTRDNVRLVLNIMVNYGGKWDLIQACRRLAVRVEQKELAAASIDEAMFAQHLSSVEFGDPDLFIRTSGEYRISNFYLWQLAYAELYFTDIHWPDFDEVELDRALLSYAARERRFGLVKSDCEGRG